MLLLRAGGQTVYFGDIGRDASSVIDYFETGGGRPCEPGENPCVAFLTLTLAYDNSSVVLNIYWKLLVQVQPPLLIVTGMKPGLVPSSVKNWRTSWSAFTARGENTHPLNGHSMEHMQLHGLSKRPCCSDGNTRVLGGTQPI